MIKVSLHVSRSGTFVLPKWLFSLVKVALYICTRGSLSNAKSLLLISQVPFGEIIGALFLSEKACFTLFF